MESAVFQRDSCFEFLAKCRMLWAQINSKSLENIQPKSYTFTERFEYNIGMALVKSINYLTYT